MGAGPNPESGTLKINLFVQGRVVKEDVLDVDAGPGVEAPGGPGGASSDSEPSDEGWAGAGSRPVLRRRGDPVEERWGASVLSRGRRRASPKRADRILVIRLGAIGDVVRTVPSVAGLRAAYPGAHLTWLVEPAAAGVVRAAGVVDETLVFPRTRLVEAIRAGDGLSLYRQVRTFVRQLRRRRFEIVLDFHGLAKSGLFAWLSGAPLRYGYERGTSGGGGAKEFANLFVNRHARLPAGRVSRFRRNELLVETVVPGIRIPARAPLLRPTDLAVARLAARLRVSGRERESGFVLLHPGTSAGARHKRYPVAAWVEVCRQLSDAGARVWLAAGASRDERRLVDRILRDSRGAALPAPETRSFEDLLALQARAGVFVSGDTGPLHAASLSGRPVVQLLGPTDPVHNEPWEGAPSRRLHVPLACSPCRRGCSAAPCMTAIPPAAVVEAVLDLLGPGEWATDTGETSGTSDPADISDTPEPSRASSTPLLQEAKA